MKAVATPPPREPAPIWEIGGGRPQETVGVTPTGSRGPGWLREGAGDECLGCHGLTRWSHTDAFDGPPLDNAGCRPRTRWSHPDGLKELTLDSAGCRPRTRRSHSDSLEGAGLAPASWNRSEAEIDSTKCCPKGERSESMRWQALARHRCRLPKGILRPESIFPAHDSGVADARLRPRISATALHNAAAPPPALRHGHG